MKLTLIIGAALAAIAIPASSRVALQADPWQDLRSIGKTAKEVCMFSSETSDSRTKTCTYNCNGGETTISIKPTSLCPRTIEK